jgi:hypothetical protein
MRQLVFLFALAAMMLVQHRRSAVTTVSSPTRCHQTHHHQCECKQFLATHAVHTSAVLQHMQRSSSKLRLMRHMQHTSTKLWLLRRMQRTSSKLWLMQHMQRTSTKLWLLQLM